MTREVGGKAVKRHPWSVAKLISVSLIERMPRRNIEITQKELIFHKVLLLFPVKTLKEKNSQNTNKGCFFGIRRHPPPPPPVIFDFFIYLVLYREDEVK